jgi:RNA polymerase sigma factor (sigma-70 family)
VRAGRAAARQPGAADGGEGQRAAGPAAPVPRLRAVPGQAYADWDAVYRGNIGWVYRLMFGKVGNRPDAEDLTAEVFLAVLRPLRLPSSVGEVRGYLLATCRTVLASYWTRALGQQVTALTEDPAEVTSVAELESMAPQRAERILAALPERYRRILQLRFLDACTIAEAARALEVSVANAKVLQHRALRRAAEIAAEME